VAAVFRTGLYIYIVLLIIALYVNTADATIDIKRFHTAWAGVLLGGGWLLSALWFRIPWRNPGRLGVLLGALIALYVVATAASPFISMSMLETGIFLSHGALFLLASQVFTKGAHIRQLLMVICAGVGLSTVYGFMQFTGLDLVPWDDTSSEIFTGLPATYGNPNFAAHMLILAILMCLALAALGRYGFLLLMMAFALHLNATGQRGGLIALAAAAGIVVLGMGMSRVIRKPGGAATGTLLVGGVLAVALVTAALMYLYRSTGSVLPLDPSLLIRYQSYASAANMLLDHPVLGHGPGVYALTNQEYWTPFESEWFAQQLSMNSHVHNDPLEIGIDAGLLAAGLWLALLLSAAYLGLRGAAAAGDREGNVLGYLFAGFFVAYAVDGLFGFNLRVPVTGAIFFIMLGVLATWSEVNPRPMVRPDSTPLLKQVLHWSAAVLLLVVAIQESRRFVSQQDMVAGLRAQARGNLLQAKSHFRAGARLFPWSHEFNQRLTRVHTLEGDFEEAVAEADRALEKNPHFFMGFLPAAHNRMLVAQQKMRDGTEGMREGLTLLDEATSRVNQLLDLVPRLAAAHRLLGQIASTQALVLDVAGGERGRAQSMPFWERAEHHIARAVEYEAEGQAELYRMLAQVRVPQDNLSGAETAMVKAVLHDPAETETWTLFRTFTNSHRRYDRARATLDVQLGRLNALAEPSPDTLVNLYLVQANILENGYNDIPIVLEAYTNAIRFGANRPEVWTNLARWAFDNGRRGNLIALVRRAYADAGEGDLLPQVELVGQAFESTEKLRGSAKSLLALIRGHSAESPMSASETYGWAARLLREALLDEKADDVCDAFLDLGITFNALDDLTTADALFRQADRCLGESVRPILAIHWGDTLVRLDRPRRAVELLREGREIAPDDLEVWLALARGLAKLGMLPEARAEYEALLARDDVSGRARRMMESELKQLNASAEAAPDGE
jgi:O-antigen ligase